MKKLTIIIVCAFFIPNLFLEGKLVRTKKVKKDLLYAQTTVTRQFPMERHSLDLYFPGAGFERKFPVVIWIHGGGLLEGAKDDEDSNPPWRVFTESGFIFCSINYRYTQMDTFPAQLYDVKAVVRFLRGNSKKFMIDTKKIGVWGFSSGGHLATLMGVTNMNPLMEGKVGNYPGFSSEVQAVCDFYGPVIFEPYKKLGVLTYWYWSWAQLVIGKKVYTTMLATEDKKKQKAVEKFTNSLYFKKNMNKASPLNYPSFKNIPFLIVHGTNDGMVPIEQSEKLHAFLKSHKINVTFKPVEGMGHGFITPDKVWNKKLLYMALNFFKKNL